VSAEPEEGWIRVTRPDAGAGALERLREVLASGWLTGGPQVEGFETALASWLDVPHLVAVNSGTSALQLALLACGVRPGDEVLVPDFTIPATANAVEQVGARAVLVDIDLATFNLDLGGAADAITPRTRALLPVHQFGRPLPLDELEAFADRHSLLLVEDAACALGAEHRGRRCGTAGRAGCFSFHPRKVLTTGEGGAIATREAAIAERCRALRSHGADPRGPADRHYEEVGFNYRMSELHAALGLAQMEGLDDVLRRRRALAEAYRARLEGLPIAQLPEPPHEGRHAYQSYVVLLSEGTPRERLMAFLRSRGIETAVPARAVHTLPYFRRRYGLREGQCPQSHRASRSALALPLFPAMSEADVDRVALGLRAGLRERLP
jgi:perosamine synthetase